jgi:protein-S-isoprenylcysteine O-methyltransferase Ste14
VTADDNPRVFVPPPLIFASLLALGLMMNREPIAFGAPAIIGIAVGLAGLGLIAAALGLFRSSKTRPEPWQPASALVSSGVYRVTRNPMYLGMALLCLGIAAAFASLAGIVMALIAAIIIDRAVVPREEAYLLRRFGEDYANYRRAVRRWL